MAYSYTGEIRHKRVVNYRLYALRCSRGEVWTNIIYDLVAVKTLKDLPDMKLSIVLSCLITVHAAVTKRGACDGPLIDEVHHTNETLKADIDSPYLLTCDHTTNTLYFSYSLDPYDDKFKTVKLNLNSKALTDINGVNNGFAQSVDEKTGDVYIGGRDGIYKCNNGSDKAEYFGANGTDIGLVFFKDNVLYYTDFSSEFMYTIINGNVSRFHELEDTKVYHFILDNDNFIFFYNGSGLYSQKLGEKDAVFFENTAGIWVRGFTTDKEGKVYVCVSNGIYSVNKQEHILEKYLAVDDALGVAFDRDNHLIYADVNSIVKVIPTNSQECA